MKLSKVIPIEKVKNGLLSKGDIDSHMSQGRYISLDDNKLDTINHAIEKKDSVFKIIKKEKLDSFSDKFVHYFIGFKDFNEKFSDLFPEGMDLKITDIEQQSIGECFFAAACISILNANPRVILRSMRDLGNNRVAVKLFSDKNESFIYELQKTRFCYSSMGIKVSVNKHKPWANMLMKAYAVHKQYMLFQGLEEYTYYSNNNKKETRSKIVLPLSYFIHKGQSSNVFKAILNNSEEFYYDESEYYKEDKSYYRTKFYQLKLMWDNYNTDTIESLYVNTHLEGIDKVSKLSGIEKKLYSLIYTIISERGFSNEKNIFPIFLKVCTLDDKKEEFYSVEGSTYENLIKRILRGVCFKQNLSLVEYRANFDYTNQNKDLEEFLQKALKTIDAIYKIGNGKNYLVNYIKDLKKFHEDGNVIAFSTKREFFGKGGKKMESEINGFATRHAYSLLRINQRNSVRGNYALTETNNTIMVCNPWQSYAAIQNRNGEIFERKKAHLKIEKKFRKLNSLNEINLDEKNNDYSFTTMMDIHESETQEDGISEIDAISFFKDYFYRIYQGEVEIYFKVMNIIQYIIYFLVQGEFVAYKHLEHIISVLIDNGATEQQAYTFIKKVSLMPMKSYDHKYQRDDFYTKFMQILKDTNYTPKEDFKYLSLLLQDIRIKYAEKVNYNKSPFDINSINEYTSPFEKKDDSW